MNVVPATYRPTLRVPRVRDSAGATAPAGRAYIASVTAAMVTTILPSVTLRQYRPSVAPTNCGRNAAKNTRRLRVEQRDGEAVPDIADRPNRSHGEHSTPDSRARRTWTPSPDEDTAAPGPLDRPRMWPPTAASRAPSPRPIRRRSELPAATPGDRRQPGTRPCARLRVTMSNTPGPGVTASARLAATKVISTGQDGNTLMMAAVRLLRRPPLHTATSSTSRGATRSGRSFFGPAPRRPKSAGPSPLAAASSVEHERSPIVSSLP